MEKKIQFLIIVIVTALIAGCLFYYFFFNKRTDFSNRNNFQIDEQTKNQIISFFGGASDNSQIIEYCKENRMNCMFYCRDINPNQEICSQLRPAGNRTGPPGGNRTRQGNWSNQK